MTKPFKWPAFFGWIAVFLGSGCSQWSGDWSPTTGSATTQVAPECDDCPNSKKATDSVLGSGEKWNPLFLSWSLHPIGTKTLHITKDSKGGESYKVCTLMEKTDRNLTLLVSTGIHTMDLAAGSSKELVILQLIVPDNGSFQYRSLDAVPLTFEAGGKYFDAFLSESFGMNCQGKMLTRRVDSDTVPGMLLRQVVETSPTEGAPPFKSITELVGLELPSLFVK